MLARSVLFALLLMPTLAQADGRSIIVLDGSGSMWGQIDGRAKLEIAREALGTVLAGIDPATELGLMAYGHREKGNCGDIELIVPPAPGTAAAITEAANNLNFLGKTPLSDAVRQAAAELHSTEEKATVILITDGIETCNADPCALGTELEASGVDFTAHVVGFGLTKEEGREVACLAENTGGRYIEAKDAGSLTEALKTAVAEPPPAPAPEPEPEPAPLAENFDPKAVLIEGGEEPELVKDGYFDLRLVGADGALSEQVITIYGRSKGTVPPGTYRMETHLHDAVVTQDVTVTPEGMTEPTVILDAGILKLTLKATAEGEVEKDAYWEVRGPEDVGESGYGQTEWVFPAGEYALKAQFGAAEVNETIVIEAGQTLTREVILGTGLAVVDALYSGDLMVEGGDHFVEIFEAKKDIDGNRKSVAYTYGAGAQFNLPAGDYVAVVGLGAAKAETPFAIKVGERSDVKVDLNAGVLAVTAPGAEYIEVFEARTDINGNRKSLHYAYGEAINVAIPAGDVIVLTRKGETELETPAVVKPGERTETAVSLP
ncbi:VWA domain-containing protein [Frigidibacter sp. SD6-1]|uniref:vWA domain-containing protein n=1 Tax=Frigidibacter sp. SD6-1 TaxID=3032581 RepID=UPI0024DFEC15|nr:VWA domain-containing protein [Frigidibacter sp. SD6-1]